MRLKCLRQGWLLTAMLAGGCASSMGPRLVDVELHGPVSVDFKGLRLSGTVRGAPSQTIQVGGVSVKTDAQGRFTALVKVREGKNRIAIRVGESAVGSVSLTVDNDAPYIVISEPLDKHRTNAETVRIAGTVRDANLVRVEVNGVSATVAGNRFEAVVPLPLAGKNDIHATAHDVVGNSGTFSVRVYRDE